MGMSFAEIDDTKEAQVWEKMMRVFSYVEVLLRSEEIQLELARWIRNSERIQVREGKEKEFLSMQWSINNLEKNDR